MTSKIRIVMGKPGLDGHTRGIQVVARGFADAGFEVIYLGLYKTAEEIVRAALDEDANAIGLSILSGASPVVFCRDTLALLHLAGADDVALFVGGIIHDDEAHSLREMGVAGVFLPGTPMVQMVNAVQTEVEKRPLQGIGVSTVQT